MKWRVVYLGLRDPYECSTLPEALLTAVENKLVPDSLYFFQYSRPAAYMLRRAGVNISVKPSYCAEQGIPLVRVFNDGSSSALFDRDQLYAFLIYHPKNEVSNDFEMARIKQTLIASISEVEVRTEKGRNDVQIGNKKVASIGVLMKKGGVRSTRVSILNDFNFDLAEKMIVPKHNMRENMTTLKAHGLTISMVSLMQNFKTAVEDTYGVEFTKVEHNLTESEKQIVAGLMDKYTSEAWIKTGRWSPVRDYGRTG